MSAGTPRRAPGQRTWWTRPTSWSSARGALCGHRPANQAGLWLGSGTQAEYERAAALPLCPRCSRAAARGLLHRRFRPGAKVSHLAGADGVTLCGRSAAGWLGLGSPAERSQAVRMPLCKRCRDALDATTPPQDRDVPGR